MASDNIKDRCPICGKTIDFELDEIIEPIPEPGKYICRCGEFLSKEDLIGEDDDYAWCI